MGKLRERMREDLILRGMSVRTQESYLAAVGALAKYYGCAPDTLNEEQIRCYLLHLLTQRKFAASSVNVAVSAIRFFFRESLKRADMPLDLARPKPPSRLPVILAREEVTRLILATPDARERTMFMTAYGTGVRVSELCALKLSDIDAARMCLRIEQGKGAKDRDTLLSPRLLDQLRLYWKQYRPAHWLFPAARDARRPMDVQVAQRAFGRALARAGVSKHCGIHGLRHAFATHLLESGVDIHTIQRLMGHASLHATLRYFHLAREHLSATASPLDLLEIPRPLD